MQIGHIVLTEQELRIVKFLLIDFANDNGSNPNDAEAAETLYDKLSQEG